MVDRMAIVSVLNIPVWEKCEMFRINSIISWENGQNLQAENRPQENGNKYSYSSIRNPHIGNIRQAFLIEVSEVLVELCLQTGVFIRIIGQSTRPDQARYSDITVATLYN